MLESEKGEKHGNLPYVNVTGTLEKMLDKIKTASVPEKFSSDFVSTKLAMKGGTARAVIPFIKKLGLVSTDGAPTERYKEYRNPAKSKIAIAKGMREIYESLFAMNEYVYDLENSKLKGLIVEATGAEADSTPIRKTLSTFNALRKRADFEATDEDNSQSEDDELTNNQPIANVPIYSRNSQDTNKETQGINLSYTINLNLPATTDIEVFHAIFKSLKQHLLQE